jgi:hypothetical protein
MDIETRKGVTRNLKESLQALALLPAEQIRVTQPGCVTCELYEDFHLNYHAYVGMLDAELSENQRGLLHAVVKNLENIPDEAFECYNNNCLEHPAWAEVRSSATAALSGLGWMVEAPAEYREVERDVWKRPQDKENQ